MSSMCFFIRFRSLLLVPVLFGARPTIAQRIAYEEPVPAISRMCLWNADRDTWRALKLKRSQVHQLDALRAKYPAVINGQWSNATDSIDGVMPSVGRSGTMPQATGLGSVGSTADAPPNGGLQRDLHAVLSDEALRKWARLCGARTASGRSE